MISTSLLQINRKHVRGVRFLKKRLVLSMCLIPFVYIGFAHFQITNTAKKAPPNNISHLIVLGAQVKGKKMSLSLANRAKAALDYLEKHPETNVIVTGGQGEGEDISEAEALKRYFLENGIKESRILIEDRSTTTIENIRFAKELYKIDEAIIVSNDFHLYRALKIAKKEGINGYPLAAETPNIAKPKMYVREYAALLKFYLLYN